MSLFAGVALLGGCDKESVVSEGYSDLYVDSNNITFALAGGSQTVKLAAPGGWEVVTETRLVDAKDESGKTIKDENGKNVKEKEKDANGDIINYIAGTAYWLTSSNFSVISGSGDTNIVITVPANEGGVISKTITIKSADGRCLNVILNQEGASEDDGSPGSKSNPYTVTEAVDIISSGDIPAKEVCVKGTINKIDEVSPSYGNATYYITDGNAILEVYRGKWINGDAFTSVDQIGIGDNVVVKGKLVDYNGTPEFTSGAALISIDKSLIQANPTSIVLEDNHAANVQVTVSAKVPVAGVFPDAEWIKVSDAAIQDNGDIIYTLAIAENADNSARSATVTVKGSKDASTAITVSQPGKPTEYAIENIINLPDNSAAVAENVYVTGLTERGFVAYDGKAFVYVYQGSEPDPKVKIGDIVNFSGNKITYASVPEIEKVTVTVVSSGNDVPAYSTKDVTATFAEYAPEKVESFKVSGEIEYDGKYYNFIVDGVAKDARYLSFSNVLPSFGISELVGKKVVATGFYNGVSGNRVNMVLVDIVEAGDVPPTPGYDITGALSAADNTAVEFTGLVAAVSSTSAVVTDGVNYIYVYNPSTVPAVGDEVTVSGTKKTYGGVPEIDKNSTVTVNSSNNAVTAPSAKDITASFDAYSSTITEYISFTGTLAKSGNYYNVNVDGATAKVGSVNNPVASLNLDALDGKKVKFTGYFVGLTSKDKYINIVATEAEEVSDVPPTPSYDIAGVISAADNTAVEFTGLVAAVSTSSMVVTDGTNNIYVFKPAKVGAIGDEVTVSGTKKTYGGVPEIDSNAAVTINSSNNEVPAVSAKDITSTFDAYAANVSEYISFTGTLAKSGNYYNVNVEGASAHVGSISYPVASLGIDALDGKKVKFTGYYVGLTSKDKYVNLVATAAEAISGGEGGEGGEGGGGQTGDAKVLTFDFSSDIEGWPAKKADAAEGEYDYTLDGVKYTFSHTKAGNGIYTGAYSGAGYLMVSQDNYLGMPAIDGMKLTKVVATNSSGCSASVEVLVTSDTSGNAVSGGAAQKWATTSSEYTYNLSDTKAATRYYLATTKKNGQIVKLVLTYEPAK